MTLRCACGASIGPDENFCGTCGARQQRDDTPVVSGGVGVVAEAGASSTEQPGMVSNDSQLAADNNSSFREANTLEKAAPGTDELAESAEFSSMTSGATTFPKNDKSPKPWPAERS